VLIGEAAVTLGAVAVGIGYSLRAASAQEKAESTQLALGSNSACSALAPSPLCAELKDSLKDERDARIVARVGFIAAGAAAAGFVGTLIFWRAPSKVAIIPSIAPGAAELSVAARF
jgi:hypothetical protein